MTSFIVMPTIRNIDCLKDYTQNFRYVGHKDFRFIVVEDTDGLNQEKNEEFLKTLDVDYCYYTHKDVDKIDPHGYVFPRTSDTIRSFGFLMAGKKAREGDIIISIDDDTRPYGDYLKGHKDALNTKVSLWHNTLENLTLEYKANVSRVPRIGIMEHIAMSQNEKKAFKSNLLKPRGYPRNADKFKGEVVLNEGLWLNVPDLDSPTIQELGGVMGIPNVVSSKLLRTSIIPPGRWTTVCFPKDTPITTADGTNKPIQDLPIGEQVITHTGQIRKVINILQRPYTGELVQIFVKGIPHPITCTPNHKLLSKANLCACGCGKRKRDLHGRGDFVYGHTKLPKRKPPIQWIQADNLARGDYLLIPRLKTVIPTSYSPEFCRLIGYFLAEGSYKKRYSYQESKHHYSKQIGDFQSITFTLGIHEDYLVDDITNICLHEFSKKPNIHKRPAHHACEVNLHGVAIANLFYQLCGQYSHSKKLSPELMLMEPEKQLELLKGYFLGDGYFGKNHGHPHVMAATISKNLAEQLRVLLHRVGLTYCKSQYQNKNRYYLNHCLTLYGESARVFTDFCRSNKKFILTNKPKPKHAKSFSDNDYSYYRISNVKKIKHNDLVYNLTVEEDHSYLIDGFAVSNCSMNCSFKPKILPAYYQLLMKQDLGCGSLIDRMGDIWSGLFLKKIADHLGDYIRVGDPLCTHNKHPRPIAQDLAKEKYGIEITDKLWLWLKDWNCKGSDYYHCYENLAIDLRIAADFKKLPYPHYFIKLSEGMLGWLELVRPTRKIK